MYIYAALNACAMVLLAIAAILWAFVPSPLMAAIFCALMFIPLFPYLFISAADNHGDYTKPAFGLVKVSIWCILVFAVSYWNNGLVISGKHQEVEFTDALYFSITTWTTLGYGDFSPPKNIRLVTSIQALLGYIAMGMLIAVISMWLPERMQQRLNVHIHNRKNKTLKKVADNKANK